MIHTPPYLTKGDCIGVVCPAGYMPASKAETCIRTLEKWGFRVRTGKTLGSRFHYFSGTDSARLQDFQQMLDDPEIKAILCGRGGYGVSRILDQIDFARFRKNPKWIIGYSDITALHAHLYTVLKTASLHAPMAAAFMEGENRFITSIRHALSGKTPSYRISPHPLNRKGNAKGTLIGGNLSLITHLLGTDSSFKTRNRILFLEDVGEYLYGIDRMMVQLKRSGKLEDLSALIIGSFTELKDTTRPFGQKVYDLIWDKIRDYDYPVCFNFPVGHTQRNYALKVGVPHQLAITDNTVTLKETAH